MYTVTGWGGVSYSCVCGMAFQTDRRSPLLRQTCVLVEQRALSDKRTDGQTEPFMRRTCVLRLNSEHYQTERQQTDRAPYETYMGARVEQRAFNRQTDRVLYETYVRAWVEQCAVAAGVVAGAGFLDDVRVAALMRRLVERPVAAATFLSNVIKVLSTAGVGPARRFFHYFSVTTANIDMEFTVI